MQITITITDEQWKEFQEVAQEAVETQWNGSYEDFATYIMSVNIDSYIESQKRKREKKLKRELASYEEILRKEANASIESSEAKPAPVVQLPAKKPSEDKPKPKVMTDKDLSERIEQLEEIPFKMRTMIQAQELNELHILRKKRLRKK